MIIERKTNSQTHCHAFCMPKPDADLCMHVDLPLGKKKTVEN